jgi:succinate dehydrogenase iron-sulfur subunit
MARTGSPAQIHIRLGVSPATVYALTSMRIIKDQVPDLTHVFAQYAMIEPWLQSKTPEPERERLQSLDERRRLDGYCECILCFRCTQAARAIGGMATAF